MKKKYLVCVEYWEGNIKLNPVTKTEYVIHGYKEARDFSNKAKNFLNNKNKNSCIIIRTWTKDGLNQYAKKIL